MSIDETERDDEMEPEYDFSGGVRGKYVGRILKGTNLVRLDPDVLAAFPDSESVNEALRELAAARQKPKGSEEE